MTSLKQLIKRLLRRITILDWIFISFSVLLLLAFYLFFKREVVFTTAKFKITDENVLYAWTSPSNEFASSFMVGDTEKNGFGEAVSEITGVETYKTDPRTTVVYLDIKLKATYNPRTHKYLVKGKNIVFGESFSFDFTKVKFKGLVVDFPGFRDADAIRSEKTVVKAQLRSDNRYYSDVYGVPDYVATAVKKGDTVKNSNGVVLVKILDMDIRPAKRLVVNNSGQPFLVEDPYLKDVFYTIELTTKEINGKTYMFNYIPVLVNDAIPINMDTVSIWPTITEIIDQTPIAQ